tara:strand:- start:18913 stop:20124 length:1212 start_codon:yes stop_codon:yes gene_type:complete
MEAMYHLFKLPLVLLVLFIISILVIIFIPKRFFNKKKWGWPIILALLIAFGLSVWQSLKPKEYEKTYLKEDIVHKETVKNVANNIGFYVGAGGLGNEDEQRVYAKKYFNSITPGNDLKYGRLIKDDLKTYDFSDADALVNFAIENDLRVRGHVLVWGRAADFFKSPNLRVLLKDVPTAKMPDTLNNLIKSHITKILNRYKGKITEWDCVNEPLNVFDGGFDNNIFYEFLGKDYIANAFRWAHEVDPDVQLYLNEQFDEYDSEKAHSFLELVKELLADGVPIHGIGIQAHAMFKIPDLKHYKTFVKKIEAIGLKFEITELDVRLRLFDGYDDPYKAQGDFYKEFSKISIQSPFCKGITVWGISDKDSWFEGMPYFAKPNDPLLFDKDMHPKPAYFGVLEALKEL